MGYINFLLLVKNSALFELFFKSILENGEAYAVVVVVILKDEI